MTFGQVIGKVQAARPSEFSVFQLAQWLADYDGQLMLEYLVPYSTDEALATAYNNRGVQTGIAWVRGTIVDEDTTSDDWTELWNMQLPAVPPPYDGLYFDYLIMMVDLHNADYERYNNDATLFAEKQKEWRNRVARLNVHRLNRYDPEHGTPVRLAF